MTAQPTGECRGHYFPIHMIAVNDETHRIFSLALAACRLRYRLERVYYQHLARTPCPAWPPVEETKCSLVTETRASSRSSSGT